MTVGSSGMTGRVHHSLADAFTTPQMSPDNSQT